MKQTGMSSALLDVLPLSKDGVLLWRTLEKYVTDYLRIFYPRDEDILKDDEIVRFWNSSDFTSWQLQELSFGSLVSLVTDMIWWVTGAHEFLGSIVEYLTNISGIMPKIQDGKDVPDVQTFTLAMIIISFTGIRQPPLMDEWTHLFKVESWTDEKQQAVLNTVRQFQVSLAACSDDIEHENILRERRGEKKVVAFDPRILETSVSI